MMENTQLQPSMVLVRRRLGGRRAAITWTVNTSLCAGFELPRRIAQMVRPILDERRVD